MRTVCFHRKGQIFLGVKTPRGIFDVQGAANMHIGKEDIPSTVQELILLGEKGEEMLGRLIDYAYGEDSFFLSEESVQFGPCLFEPQKILCIGLNYKKHADECGLPHPRTPIIFSKFNNSLSGHQQAISLPSESFQFDYEGELAIVIGKKARNVKEKEALSYVYGYCIANDFSARDLQRASSQWLLGKTCDGFCPIVPYLVSRSEIVNPNHLRISTIVNHEVRQDSNTSDMIFSCEELISYISKHMTLQPGDIILTGTPEGVILGKPKDQQIWLRAGDRISVEIESFGMLTNSLI